jgi:hypothetical protein
LRGCRKVTDGVEDFLCPTEGRPLSFEDCRELSNWNSSEMDVRVTVLASVDALANGREAPSGFDLPLTPESAEK